MRLIASCQLTSRLRTARIVWLFAMKTSYQLVLIRSNLHRLSRHTYERCLLLVTKPMLAIEIIPQFADTKINLQLSCMGLFCREALVRHIYTYRMTIMFTVSCIKLILFPFLKLVLFWFHISLIKFPSSFIFPSLHLYVYNYFYFIGFWNWQEKFPNHGQFPVF